MKLNNIISETPLPDDWDKEVFQRRPGNQKSSFKKMVDYARQKAGRAMHGSSRIAVTINYQGRPTILKIAKNRKGIAQNEFEMSKYDDYYLENLGILVPIIDHDSADWDRGEEGTWLHLEKADKMTEAKFKQFFAGFSPFEIVNLIQDQHNLGGRRPIRPSKEQKDRFHDALDNEHDNISKLNDLIGSYGHDLESSDFGTVDNWGIYQGHPVIIDIGFGSDVRDQHYR